MLRPTEATGAIIWRIRIACWITTATDKHSDYVIVTVFLQQKWLCESAPILRSYINCPYCYNMN